MKTENQVIPADSGQIRFSGFQKERRRLLQAGLAALAACVIPLPAKVLAATVPSKDKRLRLYNTHTRESLEVQYFQNGSYRQDKLAALNHLLRDHRTGDVRPISPRVIDLLHAVSRRIGGTPHIHIISGYRSPETNSRLRKASHGVAKKSLHMLGQAVDIRIPSVRTAKLRDIALKLGAGGVGYYPESDFVHVDIGPVRSW